MNIYKRWLSPQPLHVQAICANRVFAQTLWQCRVLFARLCKLLAWNQNSLIFFAQAATACAVWVLACTNKPQYKAAPTRASNLCKLVCTNCLTTAPDGTSMWRKPSGCSSYGVIFFNSFLEHALIELLFFILHISFRRLDTFPCICSVI